MRAAWRRPGTRAAAQRPPLPVPRVRGVGNAARSARPRAGPCGGTVNTRRWWPPLQRPAPPRARRLCRCRCGAWWSTRTRARRRRAPPAAGPPNAVERRRGGGGAGPRRAPGRGPTARGARAGTATRRRRHRGPSRRARRPEGAAPRIALTKRHPPLTGSLRRGPTGTWIGTRRGLTAPRPRPGLAARCTGSRARTERPCLVTRRFTDPAPATAPSGRAPSTCTAAAPRRRSSLSSPCTVRGSRACIPATRAALPALTRFLAAARPASPGTSVPTSSAASPPIPTPAAAAAARPARSAGAPNSGDPSHGAEVRIIPDAQDLAASIVFQGLVVGSQAFHQTV